ncbi:MAG: LPS translocon maturation chaperone LptM [Legionella sp.]
MKYYLFIISVLLLSACGQKGSLYLPEKAAEQSNSSIFKNK